jgi:hypothetical protein
MLSVVPLPGLPEIRPGDDLGRPLEDRRGQEAHGSGIAGLVRPLADDLFR